MIYHKKRNKKKVGQQYPELMKQAGKIKVITNRLVNNAFSGEYHTTFKGHGIEFDEVREYITSDDIRSIDWNVTARMGRPFIKKFREDRELTIVLLVDVSGSQYFGSGARSKAELSAEVACLMALSAIKNNDKVGLILFSDTIETYLPPRKGRTAVMRIVREIMVANESCNANIRTKKTDISSALKFLNNVQKRKAVVFMISDFMDDNYIHNLHITAQKHDLICCTISDPREFNLLDSGVIEIKDAETGEVMLMDTSSTALRKSFGQQAVKKQKELHSTFRKSKIDNISLSTARPFINDIRKLFHRRRIRSNHYVSAMVNEKN